MLNLKLMFCVLVAGLLLAGCGQERAPIASNVADSGALEARESPAPEKSVQPGAAEKADAELCIDPAKINPNRMCTMDYTPVCGCDGKTHSNACKAANAGLTSWVAGACDATH